MNIVFISAFSGGQVNRNKSSSFEVQVHWATWHTEKVMYTTCIIVYEFWIKRVNLTVYEKTLLTFDMLFLFQNTRKWNKFTEKGERIHSYPGEAEEWAGEGRQLPCRLQR